MSGVKGTKARRVQLPVPFLVILILCASLLKRDLPSAILVVNSFRSDCGQKKKSVYTRVKVGNPHIALPTEILLEARVGIPWRGTSETRLEKSSKCLQSFSLPSFVAAQ